MSLRIRVWCLALALGSLASLAEAADAQAWREVNALLEAADRDLATERDPEAEAGYRLAADLAVSFGPRNLFLARALDGLGDVSRRAGRWEEAAAFYGRSTELWRHLLGGDQPRLATTLHHLGLVCAESGRHEEAARHLREALAVWDRCFGPESPEAANTRRALARFSLD